MKTPGNDLERAFVAASRSESGRPGLFRQLRESPLFFLMPPHPELDGGTLEVVPGSAMSFETFVMKDLGQVVPVFTSEPQLRRALRVRNASAREYAIGSLKGETLFTLLAQQPHPVLVNAHSEMGELILPPEALGSIADGSVLRPLKNAGGDAPGAAGGGVTHRLTILGVEDHPTSLLQPIFEFMRDKPVFRAAWVFGSGLPEEWDRKSYQLAIWMAHRDAALEQDFGVVLLSLKQAGHLFDVTILNALDVEEQEWTRHVPPFFRAAGEV